MATELKGSVGKGLTDTIVVIVSFTNRAGMETEVPAGNAHLELLALS